MANKKFSDLTATTTLAAGDLLAVETALGNSRKITKDNFREAIFSGALVHKTSDETANYSAGAMVPWTSETSGYDTDTYHDNSTNNSRLTIPATGRYRLSFRLSVTGLAASDYLRAEIRKNGAGFLGGGAGITEISQTPTIWVNGMTAVISASATDYFEVWLDTESDTSITLAATESWFSIQRIS